MENALRCLLAKRPPAPVDATDWLAAIETATGRKGGAAANAYFKAAARNRPTQADAIARARAGLDALGNAGGRGQWLAATAQCPGGCVKIACSGPRAFARVLLACVAENSLRSVHDAAAAGVDPAAARAMLADAEIAACAIRAALPWNHGDSVRPAQLAARFQARVRAIVHVLQYATLPQRAPDATMAAHQSEQAVALLQLIVADTKDGFKAAHAWAANRLRVETAHAWAVHRQDPRCRMPAQQTPVQDVGLYATIRGICSTLPPHDVPRPAAVAVAALEAIVGARTADVDAHMAAVGNAAQLLAPLDLPRAAKTHSCLAKSSAQAAEQTPEQALAAYAPSPPAIAW